MIINKQLFYSLVFLSIVTMSPAKAYVYYAAEKAAPTGKESVEDKIPVDVNALSSAGALPGIFYETVGVFELGDPAKKLAIIKKSGVNKSIPEALMVIIPDDWYAKKKAGVDRELKLSWLKGKNWIKVLNEVALNYKLSILVDWNTKTVSLLNQHPDTLPPPVTEVKPPQLKDFNADSGKSVSVAKEVLSSTPVQAENFKLEDIKPEISRPANAELPKVIIPPAGVVKPEEKLLPPVYVGPQPLYIRGPLKEAAIQVVRRWGKELDWSIDETLGIYALSYDVYISGKSLEEDLQTLGDAVSNDKLRIKFDVYANNVVKLSKLGDE